MPYGSTSQLPPAVQSLPAAAKTVFMRVFNESKDKGQDDTSCFRIAWTAVKNGWEKQGDTWVKKGHFDTGISKITKVDEDKRLVGGWISIIHDGTAPVVDSQGDVIDLEDLRQAVHDFVKVRVGKAMHTGGQVAELVELVIVDSDFRKELGAPEGPVGAWAVWKVNDNDIWAKVKSGELQGFSIGGHGKRTEIPA